MVASEVDPGIYSIDGSGTGQGMVLHDHDSVLAMIRNYRHIARPARAGDPLTIYATGISETASLKARIGDVAAVIESITQVPHNPGLFGVMTRIPAGVVPGNTVAIDIAGKQSDGNIRVSNKVNIAIEPTPSYE